MVCCSLCSDCSYQGYRLFNLTYKGLHIMSELDFIAICEEKTIDPVIALENADVKKAIELDDVYWLVAILDNQF